jgi:hypothetical protein
VFQLFGIPDDIRKKYLRKLEFSAGIKVRKINPM